MNRLRSSLVIILVKSSPEQRQDPDQPDLIRTSTFQLQQLLLMRCLFVFPLLLGHFIIGKLPNDNPCLPLATGGLIYVVFSDTYFFLKQNPYKIKDSTTMAQFLFLFLVYAQQLVYQAKPRA